MTTTDTFRELALSFPGTVEAPHFDRAAFKVVNKRIFATMLEKSSTANIKLPPEDQAVFCDFNQEAVFPVPNKWGLQGWTTFDLKKTPRELVFEALNTAYQSVVK